MASKLVKINQKVIILPTESPWTSKNCLTIFKGQEFKDRVKDRDCKGHDQQVKVGLQKGLLDGILILFIIIFAHQSSHDIEPVSHLLSTVHLPLEH